ncbi:hypothetical protein CTAYLR_003973 [Chrysophaeum taylorii]|uniref:PNPLA domain-containing protein n=1 Tax=Chrysophaeum taylorii TaxID=2483200 RepID=A0AAD7UEQ1_9STRA|nr:hypothetical protein CTAYLR_003973 [Chrysophaeum taylorii]
MKPYLILSIDGGGVRGALSARLLQRITEAVPSLIRDANLIAGTSTGAIIALMLANGASPAEIVEDYKTLVPKVFGHPRYGRAWRAKYAVTPLREALVEHFGDKTTLGNLEKEVLITSTSVDGRASTKAVEQLPTHAGGFWRPAVFTNIQGSPDVDLTAVEAALRSSAAPTFFPVRDGYVDGGLWANNPSTVALAKVLLHYSNLRRSDVRILSIGTGQWRRTIRGSEDMGIAQWSPYLLDLLLDASALHTDLNAAYMLKENYCRLSPAFDIPIVLDDPTAVPELLDLADATDVDNAVAFLRRRRRRRTSSWPQQQQQGREDNNNDILDVLRFHHDVVDLAWIDAVREK